MSIKIYEAYMLRDKRQLWSVCKTIRTRAEKNVQKALRVLYSVIIEDAESTLGKENDPYKFFRWHSAPSAPSAPGEPMTPMQASRFVRSEFAIQSTKVNRNEYDLGVCVAIREAQDGRILLTPYPGSGYLSRTLRFMAKMPELRDYHYQNSSDRPSNIPAKQWAERKRTWVPLLSDANWRDKLVLEIVSCNGWIDIDPAINDTWKTIRLKNKVGK